METNTLPFFLLKICAVFWMIAGAIYLVSGLVGLGQGNLEFSLFMMVLAIGIGLLRQSQLVRQQALIVLFFFLELLLFS